MDALAELDQGVLVQPDPRDVAADRLLEDGCGARAEGGPLGLAQERVQQVGEVELGLGLHQVVDQPHGEPDRGLGHPLVDVAEDDVVPAGLALDLRVLPRRMSWPGLLLQLQGDVLGDVPEPGALAQPLDEAAAVPA